MLILGRPKRAARAFTTPLATNKASRQVKNKEGGQPRTKPLLIYPRAGIKWCGPVGNKGNKGCFNGENCEIPYHKKRAKTVEVPKPGGYIHCGVNTALMSPMLEMEIVENNQGLIDWLNDQEIDHVLMLTVVEALNRHHENGSSADVIYEDVMGLVEVITESNTEDVIKGGNNKSPMPLIKSVKAELNSVDSVDSELDRDEEARAKNVRGVSEEHEVLRAVLRTHGAILGTPSGRGAPLFAEVDLLRKAVDDMVDGEEEVMKSLQDVRRSLKNTNVRVTGVETGHGELQHLMNQLLDGWEKQRGNRNDFQSGVIGRDEFTEVKTQLEQVRNELNNSDISLTSDVVDAGGEIFTLGGGVHVLNEADLIRLNENVKGEFPVWYDVVSVFGRFDKRVTEVETLQKSEIHEVKTGKTFETSLYKAAWRSVFPVQFFGNKSSKSEDSEDDNSTRPYFTAIKTYRLFNQRDGSKGVGPILRKRLKEVEPKLKKEIKLHLKGDPEAIALATYFLRQSCEYISAFLDFMDTQFDQLLRNCHGEPPHSKQTQQEVWDLVLLLITVMFETLWTTRSEAEAAYQDPDTAQITYLRTTVKTHIEMEKFIARDFVEHPDILPKLFRHIFESFVSRSDFDKLKEEVAEFKKEAANLRLEMKSIKKSVDFVHSKLDNPRPLTNSQKKKLKQQAALAAAANKEEDSE